MKRNAQFILSDVAGSHILVPIGELTADFNGVVSLNDMAVALWNLLENDTTPEALLAVVLAEYDVPAGQAKTDIADFLHQLRKLGCLEE